MAVDELKKRLKRNEGFRGEVYDDATGQPIRKGSIVVGHPTIGYGIRLDMKNAISALEAEMLTNSRIARAKNEAEVFPWFKTLGDTRQGVVIEMIYNIGFAGFLDFKKTIAAIAKRDFELAAKEMLDSLWRKQVGHRAVELADIMKDGHC